MQRRISIVVFCLALVLFLWHCASDTLPPPRVQSITLRWVPAYEGETREQVEEGLKWSLSFLGAELPRGSFEEAVRDLDNQRFELSFGGLGFSESALEALKVIIDKIKASEEYQTHQSVDLGRFLVLTLHSSWHYYKITGVPRTLDEFMEEKSFTEIVEFAVTQSTVSHVNRILQLQVKDELNQLAFISQEIHLDPTVANREIDHYETIDVMPNGQLRFAIYDALGELSAAAPMELTQAGKPSKCLWCHETKILPFFSETPEIEGFIEKEVFLEKVQNANNLIDDHRRTLITDLNFDLQQNHTQSELLYISFMEPSARRTANEWQQPLQNVEALLAPFLTHPYDEFPFLGELYYRRWVDSLAPYETLPVPFSVREENEGEVDWFW